MTRRWFDRFRSGFTALDNNAVRVAQSVIMVAHIPAVLFVNAAGIVIFALMISVAPPLWQRCLAVGAIWMLMVPLYLSWQRLHRQPVPSSVSHRRIASMTRYSTVLGATWAGLMIVLLKGESHEVVILAVTGIGLLCVGGVNVLVSMPLACTGFSVPILVAALYITSTTPLPSQSGLLLLLILLTCGVVWMIARGWKPLQQTVVLEAEKAGLVEILQGEVQQQRGLMEQHVQAQSALADSEARFRAMTELTSDWYWEQNADFRFVRGFLGKRGSLSTLGKSSVGKTRWELAPDNDPALWQRHLADLQAHRRFTDLEYRIHVPDEGMRWLSISGEPFFFGDGKLQGYHGVGKEITDRKNSEIALRESEKRLDLAMRATRQGLFDLDLQARQAVINSEYATMIGLPAQQGIDGVDAWYRRLHPDDARRVLRVYRDFLANNAREYRVEYRERGRDGQYQWLLLVAAVAEYDKHHRPVRIIGTRLDITERKTAEDAIEQLAYYDPLTALPNRRFMMDRLAEMHAGCRRTGHVCAMLFLDLDHFKNVNDAHGHAVGDRVLTTIAKRLSTLLRTEDTAARIGGDEFVVLSANLAKDLIHAGTAALILADRIRTALVDPITVDGNPYTVGCSIGVTLFPKADETADDLLREADTAMYRAKSKGRNQTAFFESSMQAAVRDRLSLEYELARAQERNQLALHIQPQLDSRGRTVGGELLLRWTHPQYGSVSPAAFIPVAEESGLIVTLGNWVFHEACLISLRLMQAGLDIPISINVSPRQFRQSDFVDCVRDTLAATGASPFQLIFEVTEGLLIEDLDVSISRMHELASIGIRFSIDDFGTGYSSLAYLRRLPLYELKIDQSFIRDIPHDPESTAIVHAMLSMAKHLRLRVVAEGVETQEQADFLDAAECDCKQGYFYCRPTAVDRWIEHTLSAEPADAPLIV